MTPAEIRNRILDLTREFHAVNWPSGPPFAGGRDAVNVSGKVFDADELVHLVDAALDFWLTTGRYAKIFERELARFAESRFAVFTNSGSSANLLAVSALTSPLLGANRLQPGDEVITVAAGFPTTVNPIIQNGLVPVFVDCTLPTYGVDTAQLEAAISAHKSGFFGPHPGKSFRSGRSDGVLQEARSPAHRGLLRRSGAEYDSRKTGTFGDLATLSFYPAHHITTGEGGAVLGQTPLFRRIVESFRDWGRDCWCEPGKDNTCGSVSNGNSGNCPAATITNTPTVTSAIT